MMPVVGSFLMPMQVWNTEDFSDLEQFSVWREVICEAFGALDPQRSSSMDNPGFSGRVQLTELDTIRCATVEAPAHVVRRERSEIRRDPQEAFFVNLQLSGSCGIRQADQDAVVKPGDFVVLDLTRPYTIDVRPDFSIICLRVPRERLMPWGSWDALRLLLDGSRLHSSENYGQIVRK
jgi:AraC family transcriptional regulator, positive regulator of tynA and feaB